MEWCVFEICTQQGLSVKVSPIGATVCSICLHGQELTLSYPEEAVYLQDPYYLGATVGPYANRIRHAQFQLAQQQVQLTANDGDHCLHGGLAGLNHVVWQVEQKQADRLTLSCVVANGDGGFPGNRKFVCHFFVQQTELQLQFEATTDALTVVSLTNHCYFNLDLSSSDISAHALQTGLTQFLAKDTDGIPTGHLQPTCQLLPKLVQGQVLAEVFEQFGALDHCFVVQNYQKELREMAQLTSNDRTVSLTVLSDLPGIQIYSGDGLGAPFKPRQGICLEAQFWPDAPNHHAFPSTQLAADQIYQQQIIYRFSRVSPDALCDK
jgi:aldose 1-epimerase